MEQEGGGVGGWRASTNDALKFRKVIEFESSCIAFVIFI